MRQRLVALCGAVLTSVFLAALAPLPGEAGQGTPGSAEMELHHLHILLNHGIAMATEGSNLVMLGGAQTTPGLDGPTLRHGQLMIANGRELIRRSLEGPEMAALARGGNTASPLLRYTRELGEAMLAYLKHLEKLDARTLSSRRTMTLQRVNVILNHALEMASEGANLVMLAQMEMAGEVDRFSLEHGRTMISHASNLHRETMESDVVKNLREFGVTAETAPAMELTLELAADVSRIIETLARMPAATSKAAPSH